MKKARTTNDLFTWADAWVFTSLYMTTTNGTQLDLSMLVSCCDMLNHSIVTGNELNQAFFKFVGFGLFEFTNGEVKYSDVAVKVIQTAEKKKGGLFSRVDFTLKGLNSIRNGISVAGELTQRSTFTEEELQKAYEQYTEKV